MKKKTNKANKLEVTDLRVARSRELLRKALVTLLEKKTLEQIVKRPYIARLQPLIPPMAPIEGNIPPASDLSEEAAVLKMVQFVPREEQDLFLKLPARRVFRAQGFEVEGSVVVRRRVLHRFRSCCASHENRFAS